MQIRFQEYLGREFISEVTEYYNPYSTEVFQCLRDISIEKWNIS